MITMFMNHLLSWCVNCNMGMCQIYSLENHKWIGHSKRTHSHKLVYNPCNCLDMSTINPTVVLLVLNHSRPTYLTMGAHFATPNFQVLLVFMYRCQLLALVPWCSVIVINVIINGTTRWGWFATITTCWQKKRGSKQQPELRYLGWQPGTQQEETEAVGFPDTFASVKYGKIKEVNLAMHPPLWLSLPRMDWSKPC